MNRRGAGALAALSVLLVSAVTGCSTADAQPVGSTVVVAGARSGSATGWTPEMDALLDAGLSTGQTWTFVDADGSPQITGTVPLASTAANDLAASTERDAVREQARGLLDRPADAAEADPLTALTLAGRVLSGRPVPHRLILVGSLLQTTGSLRFQDDDGALIGADPSQVADVLRRGRALPDLAGVEVTLIGSGDTASPQAAPPEPARASLIALWTALLERAGAVVTVVQTPLTEPPPPGLPPVTPVPVPVPTVPTVAVDRPTTISLSDAVLGFLPDRADLRDPEGARAVLQPVIAALATDRYLVEITGTTSSAGDRAGREVLSRDRAGTVAALLIAGSRADPASFTIRAVGTDFPGFRPDRDAQGRLDPVAAAANRSVIIRLIPR